MSLKVSINGQLFDKEDAKISVYDHGLLYGDGVFEGMLSYSGRVFKLDEHLDRLYESAQAIGLRIPIDKPTMAEQVRITLEVNQLSEAYYRLVATRGSDSLGPDPNRWSKPEVITITDHISLDPQERHRDGMEIVTASTVRIHVPVLTPRIKSLNYLKKTPAKME